MSKATSTDTGSQQKPTSSNVSTPPGSGAATPSAPSTFNYAAAAAKSKAATALANHSNAASQPSVTSVASSASNSAPSIAAVVANGKHAGAPGSSTPTSSSSLAATVKPSATAAAPAVNGTGSAGHSRRQSAVSMPKAATSGGVRGSNINFGDQNATLSSSPVAQPSLGQHLQGGQPKVFGSLAADKDVAVTKDKITVAKDSGALASAATPAASSQPPPAAAKKMDFHKLFQKQAPAAEASTTASAGTAASLPSSVSAPALNASSPATNSRQPLTPSAGVRPPPSNLRTPSSQLPARFEPAQRSPSQQHHSVNPPQSQRLPSSGSAPINHYQAHPGSQQRGPQQARSPPHVPNPNISMQQMASPQMWHGAQGVQYYPHPYGPYGHPPQAWPPQAMPGQPPYDGQNAPRSPRHANMQTIAGTLAQQSPVTTTPASVGASPSSSFATPSRAPSHSGAGGSTSMDSPSQQHLGLGSASSARTFSPTAPSFTHSPSHSQSFSLSGSSLTANARSFQPKVQSKAIRIVNPDTRTAISIPPTAQVSSPSARQATLTVPSPRSSTPLSDTNSAADATTTTSASISRASTPATATTPTTPAAASSVQAQFLANVKAKAASEEAKKAEEKEKAEQAEREAKAQSEREAQEKAEKVAEEKAQREKQENEAREAREKEEQQAKEKAEEEARAKAAQEAKAKSDEAEAQSKREADEKQKAAEQQSEQQSDAAKASPLAIDTTKASRDSQQSRAAADVERMAREASSVPPTPSAAEPRTPGVPSTPRTPGTPGFGSLPAKPLSSMPAPPVPSGSTMKLSTDSLERRKRPQVDALDLSAATKGAAGDAPLSAATSALNSAKFIDNINSVSYPSEIASPKPELNENAEPRKFRYDRDFLMQFMNVFTDAPADLPPLSQIGMEAGRQQSRSGMGPPAGAGRNFGNAGGSAFGGAKGVGGAFPHKTTSEERFAIARAGGSGSGGHFANAPMGSFNAGARSHPISRAGSGSNAIPSRDLMGTGTPAGRTKSNRGRQRDPNQGGGGRSGSSFNPPEKGGPTIPMDQVVPLANSENRWQPQVAQRGGTAVKPDSPEMVQRKVKSLLNKLTLEKFDSISDQIVEWGNKSIHETDGRTLRQVIKLVFEKATDEAAWSSMYAQLSLKLQANVSDEVRDESLIGSDGQPVSGGLLFRKYLLNRCQEDYERGWAARETSVAAAKTKEAEDRAKKETNEKAEADAKAAEERGESSQREREGELLSDEYYEAQKIKRRGLGLVRFVGELFKLGTLSERIMHRCIIGLLSNVSDPEEEDVESLCKLLGTVGGMMEAGKFTNHVDVYFTRINEMVATPGLPSRMKFMLQDLIELRARGWQQREGVKDTGPKTIAQIHQDAAMAKARADMEAVSRQHGSRGGPMSRGGSRRGQTRDEGPDGFRTVGGAPPPVKPRGAGDLSHWGKIDRSSANRPATFKPTAGFFGKNKKVSEDGSNPPTRTNSMQNMFQALDSTEAEEPAQRKPLNLAPRTKPVAAEAEADTEAEAEVEVGEAERTGGSEAEEVASAPVEMTQEQVERKVKNDIKEFKTIKDLTEGVLSTKALLPSHRGEFVRAIAADAIEGKEDLARLVASLFSRLREEEILDEDVSVSGLQGVLEFLDDSAIDAPNAYKFMAIMLNALNLSEEKLDEATSTMQGEGLKPPKERLLSKMADLKE